MPGPYCACSSALTWLSPSTVPLKLLVARNESSPGISIEKLGSGSLWLNPPIWNSENEALFSVFHSASAEAIFIGCCSVMITPNSLPMPRLRAVTGTATMSASLAARRKAAASCWRSRCQAATPSTRKAPVISAASSVCATAHQAHSFPNTFVMLSITGRPVAGLILYPVGCCIHEFAMRMNVEDSQVPSTTSQIVARCTRGLRRSRPKIHRPMKVDSRKKAARPSIASGAPKTSPTVFE